MLDMQNQQIITRVLEIEQELKKLKARIKQKPSKSVVAFAWKELDLIESELKSIKKKVLDFDIDKYVQKQDVALWK